MQCVMGSVTTNQSAATTEIGIWWWDKNKLSRFLYIMPLQKLIFDGWIKIKLSWFLYIMLCGKLNWRLQFANETVMLFWCSNLFHVTCALRQIRMINFILLRLVVASVILSRKFHIIEAASSRVPVFRKHLNFS